MIKIEIANLDKFKILKPPLGCEIKPVVNLANHGLAFDSVLEDSFFSFAYDVSVQVISDYLLALLLLQRDDRGPRYIYIEKLEINVNALSEEEIEKKINDAVKKKLDSITKESE